jgi:copper chaperone NosL
VLVRFQLNVSWPFVLIAGLLLVLFAGGSRTTEAGPLPALQPLGPEGEMELSESDRCPVCAMFPARRPESAAAISLTSGETYYFCSNSCLLRSWLRPTIYLGKTQKEIERIVVRDYFSGKPIDGWAATWIAGSDVVGPMGPAIVALKDERQLVTFKKRHGGKIVFTFDQLDDALWHRIGIRNLPSSTTE